MLECYQVILKNNEELLNRRIHDLRIKESIIKQKELILEKVIKEKRPSKVSKDNSFTANNEKKVHFDGIYINN
jgi:hypothetical protein